MQYPDQVTTYRFSLNRFLALLAALFLLSQPLQAEQQEMWKYEMQPGDNIWNLAHEFLTDPTLWQEVVQINQVKNDRLMAKGTLLQIPTTYINKRPAVIRLIEVSGPVSFLDDQGNTLPSQNTLSSGQQLSTGDNASALIEFEDQTRILLSPNSNLTFKEANIVGKQRKVSSIEVLLNQGEAEVRANPNQTPGSRFVIDTPAAFATTRGTTYRVRTNGDQTAAEVSKGRIEVANTQGSTAVKARFGTLAAKNQPPQKPRKLLPAPEIPELGVIRYLPARLSWKPITGAITYRQQISASADFLSILHDEKRPATRLVIPTSLPDGHYWLRVKGVAASSLQGLETLQSFQVDARPFPPAIQAPLKQDRTYAGKVRFQWTKPEDISQFRFELADNANFSNPVADLTQTDTQLELELPEPGNYLWRVTSIDNSGKVGPPGHNNPLTLRPVPATPEPAPPTATENSLNFGWQEQEGTARYQIQLSESKDFSQLIEETYVSEAQAQLPKPKAGKYYMRLRGLDADDYPGGWSSVQQVEVPVDSYMPAIFWAIGSLILIL